MNTVFTIALYAVTAALLLLSFLKSKKKTALALKKAWKMFLSVLPQFAAILCLIGLLLAVCPPEMIHRVVGAQSGFLGMVIAALAGSAALVPVLVAFPIASQLLAHGAGLVQVVVFIATLTTVGVLTLPLEIKYLGKKTALLRNLLAFFCAFAVAGVMGVVLK